jgi:prepilin-type processing-associated H-X9-DG protein
MCTFDSRTNRRPAIYPNSHTTFAEVTDGTSNTIIFSEMVSGPVTNETDLKGDLRGVWSEDMVCAFSGRFNPNSSAGDRCMSNCTNDPPDAPVDMSFSPTYWGQWANAARSHHPGGVNVCMVDGSVHFINDTIGLATWQALISANGGNAASGIPEESNPSY